MDSYEDCGFGDGLFRLSSPRHLLLAIKKGEDSFESGNAFSDVTDITRTEKTIQKLTLIYDVVDKLRLELETGV